MHFSSFQLMVIASFMPSNAQAMGQRERGRFHRVNTSKALKTTRSPSSFRPASSAFQFIHRHNEQKLPAHRLKNGSFLAPLSWFTCENQHCLFPILLHRKQSASLKGIKRGAQQVLLPLSEEIAIGRWVRSLGQKCILRRSRRGRSLQERIIVFNERKISLHRILMKMYH